MRRADVVHLALLGAALAAAYLLPFELLLLSYAVLGPAHYFTEISWLHDRGYYLPHRGGAAVLAAIALGAMFVATPYWAGALLWSVFLVCAVVAVVKRPRSAAVLCVLGGAATAAMIVGGAPFAILGILLPTFIHVCVFTLAFMLMGAIRAKSGAQFAIVGLYLLGIAAILALPPGTNTIVPALAREGQANFGAVAPALGTLIGVPSLAFPGRVTGLLSFVYTYHYLNWFIKADVIRWADVPRLRLAAMAALSVASTALYFYNYEIGILVLLVVSLAHVLLEFPLNALTLRDLGGVLARRVTRSAAYSAPAPRRARRR